MLQDARAIGPLARAAATLPAVISPVSTLYSILHHWPMCLDTPTDDPRYPRPSLIHSSSSGILSPTGALEDCKDSKDGILCWNDISRTEQGMVADPHRLQLQPPQTPVVHFGQYFKTALYETSATQLEACIRGVWMPSSFWAEAVILLLLILHLSILQVRKAIGSNPPYTISNKGAACMQQELNSSISSSTARECRSNGGHSEWQCLAETRHHQAKVFRLRATHIT